MLPNCMYDYRPEMMPPNRVATCNKCGFDIYEHEKYYDIHGEILCKDCLDEYEVVAD